MMRWGLAVAIFAAAAGTACAQARPTASVPIEISAFGGANGTFTGLLHGRNLGITAGVDFGLKTFAGLRFGVEGRGTYPIASGLIDKQRNVLGGVVVSKRYGRLEPYGDFLFGRGQIDYFYYGFTNPSGSYTYTKSTSAVYSPGGGVNLDLFPHLAAKADFQLQRYAVPVTTSGASYSKAITVAVVYRFTRRDFYRR